jgi:3-deoxy-D-manno-octulosonic-acid transferase
MSLLRNLIYLLVLAVTAPIWLFYLIKTGKGRTDWKGRFGFAPVTPSDRRTVLIHAVSVGEVNATRELVRQLEQKYRDDVRIVISVTTNTGTARARSLYDTRHDVVRFPFDFSWAVGRFLDRVKPGVVGLVELEVWPNFMASAKRRGIPVAVINGRLSERSYRGYRRFRPFITGMFARLAAVGAQDEGYAERFIGLGTPADRVTVTGTMKWDTAKITDTVTGSQELAEAMGIRRDLPLIICGSTGPGEEQLMLQKLADLMDKEGRPVQLLIAPRKPERFDEAAAAMGTPVRRSQGRSAGANDRLFLLDTMGELTKAYALADVVVVGRSFSPQWGSDMMEPIALGKPVVIGPNTSDFADTMRQLLAGDGIVQVPDGEALRQTVQQLLIDRNRTAELAANGREVIRKNQGATARHIELLERLMAGER